LKDGWDPCDPLVKMAWNPVVLQAASAMGHRRNLEALRPELEQWVQECGIQEPWCRNPVEVPRQDTGEMVPWTRPMSRNQLDTTLYAVVSAAFAVTSALSGMRSSELAELSAGCTRREERPGGATRFRLVTRRIKGEAFGGTQDAWVMIEDVHRAITAPSALTGAAEGARLFATASNSSAVRFRALREWIRGTAGQHLGLEPVPDGPVNPRALRRTLAMTIAQRPHGLMGRQGAPQARQRGDNRGLHAAPRRSPSRIHRPDRGRGGSRTHATDLAAYQDYQRGDLPCGPGAQDLIGSFQGAHQVLNRHDPGPVTVIDDRRVERILKTKAKSLHLGAGNYCWFADPSKALCLKLAGTPDATEPLIGICDSARCTQATHHPEH